MCCQKGWIGCAILQVTQKAIVRIQFLSYFWIPSNPPNTFGYFNMYSMNSQCSILRDNFSHYVSGEWFEFQSNPRDVKEFKHNFVLKISLFDFYFSCFLQDHIVNLQEGRDQFLRETVANTSIYIGKAIIVNLLDSKSLSNFASNASTSEFKCKVQ